MNNLCTARNGNGPLKFAATDPSPVGAGDWIETRLFFGLNNEFVGLCDKIPSDTPVADWEAFLDQEITTRFPSGFTVLDAEGFRQDVETGQTVRETTRVLLVVHPDTPEIDRELETLRAKWCKLYRQDSVLRVDLPVKARF